MERYSRMNKSDVFSRIIDKVFEIEVDKGNIPGGFLLLNRPFTLKEYLEYKKSKGEYAGLVYISGHIRGWWGIL